jgi:hypothetical protein
LSSLGKNEFFSIAVRAAGIARQRAHPCGLAGGSGQR